MMRGAGIPTTVIDYSSAQLQMLKTLGIHVYYGDATRPDLLHSAGISEAKLFVIAIDDREQITELTRYAVKNYPHLHVIARAVDRNHVYELWAAGCRDIIRENYDGSVRMGRSAFEATGMSKAEAQMMADEFENVDRATMRELAGLYDLNIPAAENEPYIKRVREAGGRMGRTAEHSRKAKCKG